MTVKKQVKTVALPNELELEISKFQTKQLEKNGKKPTVKEIVTDALRKFLENEK